MKKIICLSLTLVMFLAVFSCKSNVDLSAYISEIRENIYEGDIEGIKVTVYAEKRESPFVADSYVGELKNILIVKIERDKSSFDNASIELSYSNILASGNFNYHPIGGKYVTTIEVEELPKGENINGKLKINGNESQIVLNSVIASSVLTCQEVLESVKKHDGKRVKEYFEEGKVEAEIHLRVMTDKTKNYYYVGFVNKEGKTNAYLVDGETGEVLAEKSSE